MKAYLLLENGFKIDGNIFGLDANMLGEIKVEGKSIHMNCYNSQKECVLCESSTSLKKGHSAFFSEGMKALEIMLDGTSSTYGKIVVDDLGMDYHLYDLKTFVPGVQLGLATPKSKAQDAA